MDTIDPMRQQEIPAGGVTVKLKGRVLAKLKQRDIWREVIDGELSWSLVPRRPMREWRPG